MKFNGNKEMFGASYKCPTLGGQNISFLRISDPKNRMQALSRINISVFKIDSVAILFQNVFN